MPSVYIYIYYKTVVISNLTRVRQICLKPLSGNRASTKLEQLQLRRLLLKKESNPIVLLLNLAQWRSYNLNRPMQLLFFLNINLLDVYNGNHTCVQNANVDHNELKQKYSDFAGGSCHSFG